MNRLINTQVLEKNMLILREIIILSNSSILDWIISYFSYADYDL